MDASPAEVEIRLSLHQPNTLVHQYPDGLLGLLEGQLASFWKPSLSKLYAGQQVPAASRTAKSSTPEEKAQMAQGLRDQGLSYSQIAQRLGVSKATVANYIRNYPYRT